MPRPLTLTPRLQKVYEFIVAFKQDHDGVAPSVSEIGKACDISSTSITRYSLDCLARLGMIVCDYSSGNRMISVPGGRWIPPQGSNSPADQADRAKLISSPTE